MQQRIEQQAEEERRRDARREHHRSTVAEAHANQADDQRGDEARYGSAGEVFVPQRDESEHAEAERQRDRDRGGDEAADDVAT